MTAQPRLREGQRRKDTGDVVSLVPALRSFARTLCKDDADADDLVHETLARAIATIEGYEHGTRLKWWLFTIMRNAFRNRIVGQGREGAGVADCVSAPPVTSATQE